ncbi:hypothetical protein AGIG_G4373 [Arapaima gigas]
MVSKEHVESASANPRRAEPRVTPSPGCVPQRSAEADCCVGQQRARHNMHNPELCGSSGKHGSYCQCCLPPGWKHMEDIKKTGGIWSAGKCKASRCINLVVSLPSRCQTMQSMEQSRSFVAQEEEGMSDWARGLVRRGSRVCSSRFNVHNCRRLCSSPPPSVPCMEAGSCGAAPCCLQHYTLLPTEPCDNTACSCVARE